MRPVRSSTLAPQAFSRLRCCTGESAQSMTTIPAASASTSPALSSTLPLPTKVDELGMPVASQQHAEIIEPGNDALQLHPIHQEDRERGLVLSDVVEEGVL